MPCDTRKKTGYKNGHTQIQTNLLVISKNHRYNFFLQLKTFHRSIEFLIFSFGLIVGPFGLLVCPIDLIVCPLRLIVFPIVNCDGMSCMRTEVQHGEPKLRRIRTDLIDQTHRKIPFGLRSSPNCASADGLIDKDHFAAGQCLVTTNLSTLL